MNKKDILKEFGSFEITLKEYWTFYHIKEITKKYILLEDKCPKEPKEYEGSGDVFKKMIDPEDEDDIEFRERCKKIIEWSKKHKKCPEIHIHCQLGSWLEAIC